MKFSVSFLVLLASIVSDYGVDAALIRRARHEYTDEEAMSRQSVVASPRRHQHDVRTGAYHDSVLEGDARSWDDGIGEGRDYGVESYESPRDAGGRVGDDGLSYDGKSDWNVEDEGRSDEEPDSEDEMIFYSEDSEEVYYYEDSVDTSGRAGDDDRLQYRGVTNGSSYDGKSGWDVKEAGRWDEEPHSARDEELDARSWDDGVGEGRDYGAEYFGSPRDDGLSYDGKSGWDVEDEGRSDEESGSEDEMIFDSGDEMGFDSDEDEMGFDSEDEMDFDSEDEDGEEDYYEDSVKTIGRAGNGGPNAKEIKDVMDWISHEVYMIRNPYCWKKSYPNPSVGTIPGRQADCKPGYKNDGATCRRPPKNFHAPSHVASCPRDYTNFGLTCTRKLNTGKCKWYASWNCDTLSGGPKRMVCKSGYFRCGGRCCKKCPSGYTNTGEYCHQSLHVTGLSSMTCKKDEDRHGGRCYPKGKGMQGCHHGKVNVAGLCYTKCKAGYYAETGVCWQKCDNSQVNCGAGCAKNKWTCGEVTGDQVLSPFVMAANLVTMGVAAKSTQAAKAATAGGASSKKIQGSVNVGKKSFMKNKVEKFFKLSDGTGVVQYTSPLGKKALEASKRIMQLSTISPGATLPHKVDKALKAFAKQFSDDFADQTSKEIANEMIHQFGRTRARDFFAEWGYLQLAGLIESEGLAKASMALTAIGLVDPTGIVSTVNAYMKPTCKDVIAFPCTRFNKNKGCGKLKFASSKKYRRRRLEAAMDANAIEEEFETCNDQKYELFLYVEEDGYHLDMVGKPLDSNKDECKKAFVFDDYDTGDKLVSHTDALGFADDWHERALSLGTFPLIKIEDASDSAAVINPFEYNLLTNNCATFVIEMMGYLGVPVTTKVIDYAVKALVKSPELVQAVRGYASAGEILASKGETLESLSDEKVVWRLVNKYVKDHKQPVPEDSNTRSSEPAGGRDDGSNEDFEIVEEPVVNMYEKYAEEHKDDYMETLENEYERTVEEESGPNEKSDAEDEYET